MRIRYSGVWAHNRSVLPAKRRRPLSGNLESFDTGDAMVRHPVFLDQACPCDRLHQMQGAIPGTSSDWLGRHPRIDWGSDSKRTIVSGPCPTTPRCHRPARPGDPVFQRRQRLSREDTAYWVARSSRAMTIGILHATPPSRGAASPEVCWNFSRTQRKRAQGMPDARCTRSLACK
jgi:hypothetical protein